MATIQEECSAAREAVITEFSIIKKLSVTFSLPEDVKDALRRYLLVAIYAAWEGFVVKVFSMYADRINTTRITFKECDKRIGAQLFFQKLNLDDLGNRMDRREQALDNAIKLLDSPIEIRTPISTDSNVDYDSLKAIMHKLGLCSLAEAEYKGRMAKFLSMRCKLAHGTYIPITVEVISEMTNLVTALMDEVIVAITDAWDKNAYRV